MNRLVIKMQTTIKLSMRGSIGKGMTKLTALGARKG